MVYHSHRATPRLPQFTDFERECSNDEPVRPLPSTESRISFGGAKLVEDRPADSRTHWGSRFALTKTNHFRNFWTLVVQLLLIYTGTVFLYRLCFIDFHIQTAAEMAAAAEVADFDHAWNATDDFDWASFDNETAAEVSSASEDFDWATFDTVVAVLFWIDLGINFLFTYDVEETVEVDDLRLIAKNYLKSHFWINLVACIPDKLIELMIQSYTQDSPQSLNQSVRALRLQRMSRLARLTRLTRLAKLRQQSASPIYLWFERQKWFRIVVMMVGLLWIMHFVACGWYLCAALHENVQDTWVARRSTDPDGTATLIDSKPFDQWMCAMYFTLTVFTTVGFGDISAITIGEIFYVCWAMGVGAIVHSIIISEVINVVVSTDEVQSFIKKQTDLVQAFADHTELEFDLARRLRRWVDESAKHWAAERYDRNEMKEILTGKFLPRDLVDELPAALFSGQLLQNNFLWVCKNLCNMPPRLPVIMALALSKSVFTAMEVIYQVHDYSFNMFLVASGTFAYVAQPSREGGIVETHAELSRSEMPGRSSKRRHKSVFAKAMSKMFAMSANCTEGDEHEMTSFPYVVFGRKSWFGDEGLARAAPRAHTARCESDRGELLSLSKVDMKDLGDQFPQFGARWAFLARKHERRHLAQRKTLTFGCTYRHFAAVRIQAWYRGIRGALPGDRPRCQQVAELLAEANLPMARRDSSSQPGLAAVQRDLDKLSGVVTVLAENIDTLLSRFDKTVIL